MYFVSTYCKLLCIYGKMQTIQQKNTAFLLTRFITFFNKYHPDVFPLQISTDTSAGAFCTNNINGTLYQIVVISEGFETTYPFRSRIGYIGKLINFSK